MKSLHLLGFFYLFSLAVVAQRKAANPTIDKRLQGLAAPVNGLSAAVNINQPNGSFKALRKD